MRYVPQPERDGSQFVSVRPHIEGPAGAGSETTVILLGGFEVTRCAERIELPNSAQRLLALLALEDKPLSRSYVAGQLWVDSSEDRALGNLRSALWRLRRIMGDVVESHLDVLRLSDDIAVDVRLLEAAAHCVLDRQSSPAPDDMSPTDYGTELLPGWYEEWVLFRRESVRQLCLHTLEAIAERHLSSSRYAAAIETILAAIKLEPLRETPHRLLVSIHLAEGNVSEALRAYDTYRELLRRELGATPTTAFHDLIVGAIETH